jgi:hypothetical protein
MATTECGVGTYFRSKSFPFENGRCVPLGRIEVVLDAKVKQPRAVYKELLKKGSGNSFAGFDEKVFSFGLVIEKAEENQNLISAVGLWRSG